MNRTVVHLVYSFGYGGLEQVIVNLINNSGEYDIEHIIITLVDVQDLYSSINKKIKIHCLYKKPQSDLNSHIELFKLIKKINPDVLNTYNFGTIEYNLIGFLAGVKTRIHCDHGYGGDDSSGTSYKRNILRKFISFFLDKYIVVSPDLLAWGKQTLHLSSNKLKLVLNGVNTASFKPDRNKSDKFTICTVGRSHPIKNQSLLINAYKNLLDHYPDFINTQLLIVGDGPIFNELVREVKRLNMQNNILLLGYRDDVAAIMNRSDLFVLTSNYEAMPMTILEAMACGLPVISTDVGGAGELVSNEMGWLIPKDNVSVLEKTLFTVLSNKSLLLKKASKGRQLVEAKYSIDKMVTEYLKLYGVEIK